MSQGLQLRGQVRHYSWGGREFIPILLGVQPDGEPWAELWLGAHPQDSGEVLLHNEWRRLDQLIASAPAQWLGQSVAKAFGELPYLLKVLDVDSPLSIQVHPNAAQAKLGYAKENAQGLELTDPKRNFKDENHKPELALALSDFWLLYGLVSPNQMIERLSAFSSLQDLTATLKAEGPAALLEKVFLADSKRLQKWLNPIFDAVEKSDDPESAHYWIAAWRAQHANHESAADAGVLAFLLMNIVKLQPGESIYQEAGVPHAYLRGQCVEIMANSDNVLRAGLTSKHVDAELMLQHLDLSRCSERRNVPPDNLAEFQLHRYVDSISERRVSEATTLLTFAPHPELPRPNLRLQDIRFFAEATQVSINVNGSGFVVEASPNL